MKKLTKSEIGLIALGVTVGAAVIALIIWSVVRYIRDNSSSSSSSTTHVTGATGTTGVSHFANGAIVSDLQTGMSGQLLQAEFQRDFPPNLQQNPFRLALERKTITLNGGWYDTQNKRVCLNMTFATYCPNLPKFSVDLFGGLDKRRISSSLPFEVGYVGDVDVLLPFPRVGGRIVQLEHVPFLQAEIYGVTQIEKNDRNEKDIKEWFPQHRIRGKPIQNGRNVENPMAIQDTTNRHRIMVSWNDT